MGKYIHYYRNKNNFESDRLFNYVEPWTSFLSDETQEEVKFNKTEEEKERDLLYQTPLTFEITGDGNIVWSKNDGRYAPYKTIEYRLNDGEWTSITSDTGSSAPSITVVSGDTIQFRGNNITYGTDTSYNTFSGSTAQFNVKGNIMSLINSTNFSTLTTLSSAYTFYHLFDGCTGLTDASELLLPATILANYCYNYMFSYCTVLTTAPELPATTLARYCYYGMFRGCTSLTTAPELPATTLAYGCYYWMFDNCRSLTTAPELPATTLVYQCYQYMFSGCRSLTTAPELPATTLAYNCYQSMFYGCSNLNYIKCLATDISASNCTTNWVGNVAASGTFVKATGANWPTGTSGIPTGWTVQDITS